MMQALDIPAAGFEAYAWPGGYPIIYLTRDGGTVCAKCASREVDNGQAVIGHDIYWEGPSIECDDCGVSIESAYGDPEADKDKCENPGRFCKCDECQNTMADLAHDAAKDER